MSGWWSVGVMFIGFLISLGLSVILARLGA